jgi:hypothetical protein
MATPTRPYGLGHYGLSSYSTWRFPEMAHRMGARASIQPNIIADYILYANRLGARSGIIAEARLYWEQDLACDTTWTPRPAPPFYCPEGAVHG